MSGARGPRLEARLPVRRRGRRPRTSDAAKFIWREWPTTTATCARRGWCWQGLQDPAGEAHVGRDHVVHYDFAEPGFVLVDRVNEMNNTVVREHPRHQPVRRAAAAPYGSCLLGSINLHSFVRDPFADDARFDWDEYRAVVKVFTRMLDNVSRSTAAARAAANEIMRKRRHGMVSSPRSTITAA